MGFGFWKEREKPKREEKMEIQCKTTAMKQYGRKKFEDIRGRSPGHPPRSVHPRPHVYHTQRGPWRAYPLPISDAWPAPSMPPPL